jgi:SAM-dependent MidA family methyltransferase
MWILREIRKCGGEITFRDFMELALYHPEHGYYTSGSIRWGRAGDFLTAPTASEWYGAVWGGLLTALARASGEPVVLVDVAAGDGRFLASVIDALGADAGGVLARVVAVDRARVQRARAARWLADGPVPVEIAAASGVAGSRPSVVHASELYDAMPVHRVEQRSGGLIELTVIATDDALEWGSRPAAPELESYLTGHDVTLEPGQVAEINLSAERLHLALLERIENGIALTLDYGYSARRLYDSRGRRRGSLATYRRHALGSDPLESPGNRDLTAHVNWDDLRRAGTSCGWREIGLMPLAEFLVRSGLGDVMEARGVGIEADLDADTVAARQEIKRLLDPEGMGSDLKMLVQGRGELASVAEGIFTREI